MRACREAGARKREHTMNTATVPLVETHAHLDILESIVELQIREGVRYALLIDRQWKRALATVRAHPQRTGALLHFNPRADSLSELEKTIRANPGVVQGIKLHPSMDRYEVSARELDDVFAVAEGCGVLVASHTDAQSPAGRFRPIMDRRPTLRFIAYHACPGPEAFELVNAFANVYIDTSFTAWGRAFQQQALAAIGKDRILFGIDSPLGFPCANGAYGPHYRDAAREVAEFYDSDSEVCEAVFHRNAARLLNMAF